MSAYDEMTTAELADALRSNADTSPLEPLPVGYSLISDEFTAALADRLEQHARIVRELLDWGEPIADYAGQCGCCDMGKPRDGDDWEHDPACPWLLAQEVTP